MIASQESVQVQRVGAFSALYIIKTPFEEIRCFGLMPIKSLNHVARPQWHHLIRERQTSQLSMSCSILHRRILASYFRPSLDLCNIELIEGSTPTIWMVDFNADLLNHQYCERRRRILDQASSFHCFD